MIRSIFTGVVKEYLLEQIGIVSLQGSVDLFGSIFETGIIEGFF